MQARKFGPRPKTSREYEEEAIQDGRCLLHPGKGAARTVYIKRYGPIPAGLCVCHTCDKPRCIKDAHHWLGTHAENAKAKFKDSKYLARFTSIMKLAQSRPEVRRKMSQSGKRRFENAEERAKTSAASKRKWAEPAYRKKTTDAIRLGHQTPEARQKASESAFRRFADPRQRALVGAQSKLRWQNGAKAKDET